MTVVNLTSGKLAKSGDEKDCTKSAIGSTQLRKIALILKAFWPVKTAPKVAFLTGTSERCVKFWLAGETRMSLENVVALLKTDAGYEILQAILGEDCKAEWWIVTQSAQDIRKSRRAIKKEQARIAATRAQLDLLQDM